MSRWERRSGIAFTAITAIMFLAQVVAYGKP